MGIILNNFQQYLKYIHNIKQDFSRLVMPPSNASGEARWSKYSLVEFLSIYIFQYPELIKHNQTRHCLLQLSLQVQNTYSIYVNYCSVHFQSGLTFQNTSMWCFHYSEIRLVSQNCQTTLRNLTCCDEVRLTTMLNGCIYIYIFCILVITFPEFMR